MGKVSEILTQAEEMFKEHVAEHTDCPVAVPKHMRMDDKTRASMIYMLHEARRRELIDDTDGTQLETILGTAGDDENYGWPEGVQQWQKYACAVALSTIAKKIEAGYDKALEDPLVALLEGVQHGGHKKVLEVDGDDLPEDLVRELLAHVRGRRSEAEQDKSARDWQRAGYL